MEKDDIVSVKASHYMALMAIAVRYSYEINVRYRLSLIHYP